MQQTATPPTAVLKVRDVMTSPAVTIAPDATFIDVIHCLLEDNISGVPVVDPDGALLGIVTEADLAGREAFKDGPPRALGVFLDVVEDQRPEWLHKAAAATAADLMTTNVFVAGLDEELPTAARRMLAHGVKRLPVVRHGRVVGVLSQHDLLRAIEWDRAATAVVDGVEAQSSREREQETAPVVRS